MHNLKFDDSPDVAERGNYELIDDLTDEELEEAISILLPLSKGICLVTGAPGSGKDLFSNTYAWKQKTYLKDRHVKRDEIPRIAFGEYEPFNMSTLGMALIDFEERLEEEVIERGMSTRRLSQRAWSYIMSDIADKWLDENGEMFRNAIIYLVEVSRYQKNREPFKPINIFLGQLWRRWRHYDLLAILSTQWKKELDKTTCLPYVTHEVRCKWSMTRANTGIYNIVPVRTVGSTGVFEVAGTRIPYVIDGGKPRDRLNGKRYFDLYNSKS